jgi:hypothetical protein
MTLAMVNVTPELEMWNTRFPMRHDITDMKWRPWSGMSSIPLPRPPALTPESPALMPEPSPTALCRTPLAAASEMPRPVLPCHTPKFQILECD